MIALIDYNSGNICSVSNSLKRLGAEFILTSDRMVLENADRIILPGVGNAAEAVANLRSRNLDEVILRFRRPVLGICVGMQMMCRMSEEGDVACLGIFDCDVRKFTPRQDAKVPHMGWNSISNLETKLYKGIEEGAYVYFVHSYRPGLCSDTCATCRHGDDLFSASLRYENFYGTQFHPEKSGSTGERILKNFLEL